jgi:hypothetical protein
MTPRLPISSPENVDPMMTSLACAAGLSAASRRLRRRLRRLCRRLSLGFQ